MSQGRISSAAALPLFLDFEASSLGHKSYPIEVAWSYPDGRIEAWLIDPSGVPGWSDWDAEVERTVHGISRAALSIIGRSPRWVARRLNARLAGQTVYCDGGELDEFWRYRLFQAAGLRPSFQLREVGDLFERYRPAPALEVLARNARAVAGQRHRAALDVGCLQLLWALIGEHGRGRAIADAAVA